jgi:hypothetical protein
VEIPPTASSALGETDPISTSDGRCGEADQIGEAAAARQIQSGEAQGSNVHLQPGRRAPTRALGDDDHGPASPPPHTIRPLLAAAVG